MVTLLLNRIPDSYEIRAFSDDLRTDAEIGTFTGHASMFWNTDSYLTAMAPKSFRKTLADKRDRIPVLFFHEPTEMIGPARTLKEDRQGLYHESKAIEDGRTGSYVLAHMRGGTSMGMSFGFKTRKDRASTEDDPIDMSTAPDGVKAKDVRVITEVELFEISVLPWTFAANPKADITSVRSDLTAQALESISEELRSGSLTPEDDRWALLQSLVVAYQERCEPEPSADTPLPGTQARHRIREASALLALAQHGITTGVTPS